MHIEPGVLSQAKIVFATVAATGALWAIKQARRQPLLAACFAPRALG